MKNSRDNTPQAPRGSPVKRRIKSVVFFCLYYSGLEWLLSRLIRVDATAILMYHGVCDESPMPPDLNFHLQRSVFEQQMRVLKRRYPVLALRDVVDALARGERPKKAIVLTFDDGYRNNAQYATPILTQLQLPVTVFVAKCQTQQERRPRSLAGERTTSSHAHEFDLRSRGHQSVRCGLDVQQRGIASGFT